MFVVLVSIGVATLRGIDKFGVLFDDLFALYGFQLGVVEQLGKVFVREAAIAFPRDDFAVIPPCLDDAVLLDQRIEEPRVQDLLPEHMVDVIGLLLCKVDVFIANRVEGDQVVLNGEDAKQGRHHAVDDVSDVGGDYCGTAGDLVAELAGPVVSPCLGALVGDLVSRHAHGIFELPL